MATVLDATNISEAKAAIAAYRSTCDNLFSQMKADIESLTGSDFIGEASLGYMSFFNQITPALTTNLTGTGEEGSITSMLESLLTAVEQMLNPVDPQLKNANENAAN